MSRRNNKQLRNKRNNSQHARKRPLGGKKAWKRLSLKNKKFNLCIINLDILEQLLTK